VSRSPCNLWVGKMGTISGVLYFGLLGLRGVLQLIRCALGVWEKGSASVALVVFMGGVIQCLFMFKVCVRCALMRPPL
jgi:uncharacterized membrane protein YuzA (DUF378 family)